MQVMQEFYGLENDQVLWTSLGFGGGICGQDLCGALTGGVSAIGLDSGNKIVERDKVYDRDKAYALARERTQKLYRAFQETFGHVKCLDLVGPTQSNPEWREWRRAQGLGLTTCRKYQEFVVTTLVKWEEESA
ncbi:MAG: C-GCAxxG-C-C family protein [Chloroflexota bacterium]